MAAGKEILLEFRRRWQKSLWLEILLFALGPALLILLLTQNKAFSGAIFLAVALLFALLRKPWKIPLEQLSSYIDRELKSSEYSSGLLLLPPAELSGLARLQQQRVAAHLRSDLRNLKPLTYVKRAGILSAILLLLGLLGAHYELAALLQATPPPVEQPQEVSFRPVVDSVKLSAPPPALVSQRVSIRYPEYTRLPASGSSDMNIRAVEGSRITWEIRFDAPVDSVGMESVERWYPMQQQGGAYTRSTRLEHSGFYNFRFRDSSNTYISELYSLEVIRDSRPQLIVQQLDPFTSFEPEQEKRLRFSTSLRDDFGLAEAYIVATVSKGSGESVKFREERLPFDRPLQVGSRQQQLPKEIDLESLQMQPGDELYFYVEALDQKQPRPNVARSETFFAVIRDTSSLGFAVEGSMGVDLMPAYFRSQRQLIIDTERLISRKKSLSEDAFNATSNDLGFDQKVLRLRYGQFMGDETETAVQEEQPMAHSEDGHNEEDPLADYSHRHDGDNEHNLVVQEEQAHQHEEEEEEDPLHAYVHNHDDPEESTLFAASLKSKLRQALNEMWDAELQLRLYQPQRSLPYQYRALDLLQEIKNAARIYVHRIGFDPPPIREDSRLSGDLSEVTSSSRKEELQQEETTAALRGAVARLEQLIHSGSPLSEDDRQLFEQAGRELALMAIETPGSYLEPLQDLKTLTGTREAPRQFLLGLQRELSKALPLPEAAPGKAESLPGELNKLLLTELEAGD